MKQLFITKTRWLVTIILLTALGIGNAWGEDETLTITGAASGHNAPWTTSYGSNTGNSKTSASNDIGLSWTNVARMNTGIQIKAGTSNNFYSTSYPSTNNIIKSINITMKTNTANLYGSTDGQNWTSITYTSGSAEDVSAFKYKYFKVTATSKYCVLTSIVVTYTSAAPAYTITATRNNDSYGTVEVSGTTITATPNTGYRVIAGDGGYSVKSGTATVVNNGDNTFTVTPSSNCTVQINFEAIPKYTVTLKDDNTTITQETAGAAITLPIRKGCAGYTFAGWTKTWVAPQDSWTTTAPTIIPAGDDYTPTANENLYPVYTKEEGGGEPVETKTQTFQYDTWNYGGSSTDKTSYRLFHNGGYVESASDVNFSKLSKVIVYGGTFGGTSYNGISIKKADGTLWKDATVSGTSQTGVNTITQGASLTGSAKLRVYSTKGTASGTGVRISKVEVYTMEGGTTTSYISVPNCCTPLGSINGSI